jgi:tetratricopeptide (TPR) repeat protein
VHVNAPRFIVLMVPLAAALSAVLLSGCGSTSRASVDYEQAYQQGRYSEAQHAAGRVAERGGADADRARLVAGLAAHAAGDSAEAALQLSPLADHREDGIAGPASATLGLIAAARGQHAEAADRLTAAAERLTGDDEVRARVHAAMAYEALGRAEQAALQRRLAMRDLDASRLPASSVHHRGVYAIQLGAFSSRARAARMVELSRGLASAHNLGAPRIERTRGSGGETLYLVHLGQFGSRAQAERVQRSLGVTSVIAGADVD